MNKSQTIHSLLDSAIKTSVNYREDQVGVLIEIIREANQLTNNSNHKNQLELLKPSINTLNDRNQDRGNCYMSVRGDIISLLRNMKIDLI